MSMFDKKITHGLLVISMIMSASFVFASGGGGNDDTSGDVDTQYQQRSTTEQRARDRGSVGQTGGTLVSFYDNNTQSWGTTIITDDNNGGWNSCVANYGASCSSSNTCNVTNSGSITCSGACSASAPAMPALYGQACGSGSNSCGLTHSGTYQCDSSCSVPTTPPSDDTCPVPLEPDPLPDPDPEDPRDPRDPDDPVVIDLEDPEVRELITCDVRVGESCSFENESCGLRGGGFVGCDGSCQAPIPSDELCTIPGRVITCQSGPNSCGQVNTLEIQGSNEDDCPLVETPSESSCGIPTLGLRTKDGRLVVQEGRTKTLVWNSVQHATECRLSGGGIDETFTNYVTDQEEVPWTNTMPAGESETNQIFVATFYTLQCRNGTGPWVSDSLRIVPLPTIIEN